MSPFDCEFFGGRDKLDLEAGNLFGMVRELDALSPGFGDVADARAQFAIDGVVVPDWSTSLAGAAEVIVLPRVGGG